MSWLPFGNTGPSNGNTAPSNADAQHGSGMLLMIGVFLVVTAVNAAISGKTDSVQRIVRKDLQNPWFLVMAGLALGFSWWGMRPSHSRAMRQASLAALTALLVAWFAHVDLVFAAYVLVFIVTYYFHNL